MTCTKEELVESLKKGDIEYIVNEEGHITNATYTSSNGKKVYIDVIEKRDGKKSILCYGLDESITLYSNTYLDELNEMSFFGLPYNENVLYIYKSIIMNCFDK